MKLPRSVPTPLFVGVIIFLALLYGSYVAGSSTGPSSHPVYITDGTGGNEASVNRAGHVSVHIADPSSPPLSGLVYDRHMAFPSRSGLLPGQCYAAFIRGSGQFVSAAVHFDGRARPEVLIRVDPNPVWVVTGRSGSTPIGAGTGFSQDGDTDIFGYANPLTFKSFVGAMLCWHGKTRSSGFEVQLTAANGGGNPYLPEELVFQRKGHVFSWKKLQGPRPMSYQIYGTLSTIVSYYEAVPGTIRLRPPELHRIAKPITFTPHAPEYTETANSSRPTYLRYYLFEVQLNGDPTRVGPFGSFAGE